MEAAHALLPAILLLLVGLLAITLTRPLGLSPIVGYLAGGVIIGPHGLGLIQESHTTHLLAELGVVFLLFDIGLHFSLNHLWEARRDILGFGPLQMVLCTLALGGLGMAVGLEAETAVIIGATLALSSTAVAVQTLVERNQQGCPVGLSATAVLIFQDVCAIFLLILAASLNGGGGSLRMDLGLAALKAVAAFGVAMVIGRYLINPLLRRLTLTRSEEVFTTLALLIVLITAAATGALGLSLTLGAFLGGMILAETPYRHLIQTEVKPFRGLLLGFFFITVGMALPVAVLAEQWLTILAVLVGLMAVKTGMIILAALACRIPVRVAVQLGFVLSQGSEFAFVILAMAGVSQLLGQQIAAVLIAAVAASLALTPTLAGVGNRLARRLAARRLESDQGQPSRMAPVVIVGMGELGRRVADALAAFDIGYLALEVNPECFIRAIADGYPVAFGDAGDPRLLETIDLTGRPSVVVTLRRYQVSQGLTPILRERYPELTRFIGVPDELEAERYRALGMRAVVERSHPRGLDLAAAVLGAHGVEDHQVLAWMQKQQELALAAA
ncbi:MAG: cation:proton antiporter [Candidatus Competibacteraceae bacterium]|nr:cation:proton antiporter [Candidatus Competibacteraceae bacterium]